ncbi:uncharacterized protein LOC120360134 isoform X1 [Saimiri boliviensis]|uniref:uncharacterized protein LOC120360134 isoform X1 n=1 Tax=Saimiri boliviensis TaxID=27679 RepID=UPI00193E9309|nr:translation initiation factor IF-2-like [Saimiri boliviensis boliviensis]
MRLSSESFLLTPCPCPHTGSQRPAGPLERPPPCPVLKASPRQRTVCPAPAVSTPLCGPEGIQRGAWSFPTPSSGLPAWSPIWNAEEEFPAANAQLDPSLPARPPSPTPCPISAPRGANSRCSGRPRPRCSGSPLSNFARAWPASFLVPGTWAEYERIGRAAPNARERGRCLLAGGRAVCPARALPFPRPGRGPLRGEGFAGKIGSRQPDRDDPPRRETQLLAMAGQTEGNRPGTGKGPWRDRGERIPQPPVRQKPRGPPGCRATVGGRGGRRQPRSTSALTSGGPKRRSRLRTAGGAARQPEARARQRLPGRGPRGGGGCAGRGRVSAGPPGPRKSPAVPRRRAKGFSSRCR